ncbi:TlpA disulfide reductase family protein [Aeromonas enteropelogenes]|uniref:TlpA disulfide reductase family protein n=1 Tax=Aeromonas enteropelogenes TaxID=29489 RepID=UPI002285A2D4|nr:TlpA disulfide reductase family protein [Aeromonas enteropelogenes]MCZ0749810.1 TlpA disulfide reductase family protein [Aeromonas enteropelogenes]
MVRVSGSGKELKRICWAIVAGLLSACTPAPEFTDAQGLPLSLSHFAGKPLLVNYFAPWCSPCLREMPRLAALAREGEIAVVAINYDPATPAELAQLAERYDIPLPLLIANETATLPFPRPTGLPTSYLLDGQGRLQQTLVGELDQPQIDALKAATRTLGN